jgi:hypothetical protein
MRILIILWAFPLIFFWGWYGLSYFDINFGIAFLNRHTHNVIFALYGQILGMPASEVPFALVKIFAFDSMLVLALAAWRWRKDWYPQTKEWLLTQQWVVELQSSRNQFNQHSLIGPVRPAE